jgi:cell division protein FtsQ
MTTLDVRIGQLRTAVGQYPVVKDVRASTQFPHGMRIRVLEQLPVAALVAGGHGVAVAGDGTLLHDVGTGSLPAIGVGLLPGGSQVTDGTTLAALALLSVTPSRMLTRIAHVTDGPSHGLVAQLRSGPSIYFGDRSDLAAKWVAATEVLADPNSAGASYVDVSDPSRPAAGASPGAVAAAGLAPGPADSTTSGAASATGSTATPSTADSAASGSASGG